MDPFELFKTLAEHTTGDRGFNSGQQSNNPASTIPTMTVNQSGMSLGLINPDTGQTNELFSLGVRRNHQGIINGATISGTNLFTSNPTSNSTPNTKSNVNTTGVHAEVSGPVQGDVKAEVRTTDDLFKADVDFDLKQGFGPVTASFTSQEGTNSPQPNHVANDMFSSLINLMDVAGKAFSSQDEEQFSSEQTPDAQNNVTYDKNGISGYYCDDVDLLRIDKLIKLNFKNQKKEIPKLQTRLAKLQQKEHISYQEENEIKQLENIIQKVLEEIDYIKYYDSTVELLSRYKNLKSDDIFSVELLQVIMLYIKVAGKFITINLTHIVESSSCCRCCGFDMSDIYPDQDDMLRCPDCHTETEYLQTDQPMENQYKGKNQDSDMESILKKLDYYCGRGKEVLPENMLDDLDEYFQKRKDNPLKPAAVIRSQPLVGDFPGRRRKERTSRELMEEGLEKTGYNKYYNNIPRIMHLLWGWELPDVDSVRDLFIEHVNEMRPVYNENKGDRKSNINSSYETWRQLWHLGYPCHPADFKIVSTASTLAFYEKMFRIFCQQKGKILGLRPFVPIDVLMQMDIDTLELPSHLSI